MVTCHECGVEFERNVFCSAKCRTKASSRAYRAKQGKKEHSMEPCQECGMLFDKTHDGHIFCSAQCRRKATNRAYYERKKQAKQAAKPCVWCGKPIISSKDTDWCSKECRTEYKKTIRAASVEELTIEEERRQIAKLRVALGLKPLPTPKEIECLGHCDKTFISPDPTNIRVCESCQAINSRIHGPDVFGGTDGADTRKGAKEALS